MKSMIILSFNMVALLNFEASLEKLASMILLQAQKNMKRKKRQKTERNPGTLAATLRSRQQERMRYECETDLCSNFAAGSNDAAR